MIPNALTIHKLIEHMLQKNVLHDDLKCNNLDVEDRKYHYFSMITKEEHGRNINVYM